MKHIKGSSIHDGIHHDHHHHECQSRRDFLKRLGLMTAGGALLLQRTPVKAIESNSLFQKLAGLETNKVLVLIQLDGGNDGLNTVVQVENDFYYNARPSVAIAKEDTISLTNTQGLHPSMSPLQSLWDDGKLGIIQSVGYPEQDLSHFRSTDIWLTASDAEEHLTTGWMGRKMEYEYPDFQNNPSDYPLAVQIGNGAPLIFQGDNANMGMSLNDIELIENLVNQGIAYSLDGLPDTVYGDEMRYSRTVANNSYRHADAIKEAFDSSTTRVEYNYNPQSRDLRLGRSLSIVSRLIKGNLGSKIYLVRLDGFDTHANQADDHSYLLSELSQGVRDFYDDLAADNCSENVLIATFSEFGRRVYQNGSDGTDHGAAAPLFVFGDNIEGGFHGVEPDLSPQGIDEFGNVKHQYDFRQVYSSLLTDWFELDKAETESVLGGDFEKIPFISGVPVSNETEFTPDSFKLNQNYPNPFNPSTTISFELNVSERVQLDVFDVQGRRVARLADKVYAAGQHSVQFNAGNLASGIYIYRVISGEKVISKQMTLIK